jgi:predicted site-specific integrase-resolvase
MHTTDTLSNQLSISKQTLARWRVEGNGPVFCSAGRKILYAPDDVAAWLARNRRQSTSQLGGFVQ